MLAWSVCPAIACSRQRSTSPTSHLSFPTGSSASRRQARAYAGRRAVYFDLDTAVQLWPDRVAGNQSLFARAVKDVLPVLRDGHEAVILIRLLCEEGVIGARSASGREGPVVGRSVRHTGSRPLLLAEIAEHWRSVSESCLLRWSLDYDHPEQHLLDVVRSAYKQELQRLATGPTVDHVVPYTTILAAIQGTRSGAVTLTSQFPAALAQAVANSLDIRPSGVSARVHACITPTSLVEDVKSQGLQEAVVVSGQLTWLEELSRSQGHTNPGIHIELCLPTWSCSSPSIRAKFLKCPKAKLLEEHRLAELLQVTHLKAVMDGIAWV